MGIYHERHLEFVERILYDIFLILLIYNLWFIHTFMHNLMDYTIPETKSSKIKIFGKNIYRYI